MTDTFKFDLKNNDNVYLAFPNDDSANGFFFYTYEQYLEHARNNRTAKGELVEVYGIICVEGWHAQLFHLLGIDQNILELWFKFYLELEPEERFKVEYMIRNLDHTAEAIPNHIHELNIFAGDIEECLQDHLKQQGLKLPTHLEPYFDFDGYTRKHMPDIFNYESLAGGLFTLWSAPD